jgi:hypothetical protein
MPSLVTFVEGEGEESAVPVLLGRILTYLQRFDWYATRTIRVGSLGSFRKRLDSYLEYVRRDPDCGGAIVLLDLDDGCPKNEAFALAEQIHGYGLPFPVAIVFAHREYEAWFLASIWTISNNFDLLPNGLTFPEEPEKIRAAKAWITNQMPQGKIYKETIHQKKFSQLLSLRRAYVKSRSFRRLCGAVVEILTHSETGARGIVTPRQP